MVTTLNFVGVTNPAGVTSHKATEGIIAGIASVTKTSGTEASQTDYDNVESANGTDYNYTVGTGGTNYTYQLFRFYTTADFSALASLKIYALGRAESGTPDTWGYGLYVYNNNTTSWESLGSHSNNTNTAVTVTKTTNLTYYKDASDYVYVCAYGTTNNLNAKNIWTDYAYLELTDGATAPNLKINIADTFKTVSASKVNIGDTWKTINSVKVNIGDTWKTI